ncbi:hypothetical protein BaRGS_00021549 [Batillaria attramentaria]|uniref:Uncharacterized protein n=1 Tax=Batillaria attramentaria TaxID=370345 RepID=A0ABD0KJQ3_9CAEN
MDKQNDDVCGYQTDTTNQLHETATAVGNDHFQLHTPNNRTTGQEMSNKENPYEQLRTLNSTKDNGYEQRRTSNSNNQNGYEQLRTSDSNKETEYEQLNAPVEKTDHKHAQLRNGKSNQAFEDDEVSKTEETRRETQPRVAVPDGSEERPAVAVSSRTETPATSNTDVIIEETSQNVRNASDMSVVPDGGFRGWLVVLSSFLQYSIAFGTSFSIGVFFVPLRDFFGSSNADTAWLAAVQIGTLFLLGK